MRVRSLAILIPATVLALISCNRPASEPPPNVVATSVAATRLFVQRVLLSATPLPTITEIPSFTPTAFPTATLSPTDTPGPSPTPTGIQIAENDPRFGLNLSTPNYVDDFSQRFLWYEFSSVGSATVSWADGKLHATDHKEDPYIWWTTSAVQGGNLYLEVKATIDQCESKDGYGVGLRVGGESFDHGYALEFSCDGAYRIRKFISGSTPSILQDWTSTEAILAGPEQTNIMGFLADGPELYIYANSQLLNPTPINDWDYTYGIFSLYAMANDSSPVSVTFDRFQFWNLGR